MLAKHVLYSSSPFVLVIWEMGCHCLLKPAWTVILLFYTSRHCWHGHMPLFTAFSIEIVSCSFGLAWNCNPSDLSLQYNLGWLAGEQHCAQLLVEMGPGNIFAWAVLEPRSSWFQPPKQIRLQVWATRPWMYFKFLLNHLSYKAQWMSSMFKPITCHHISMTI
jgi:hypothetical protein